MKNYMKIIWGIMISVTVLCGCSNNAKIPEELSGKENIEQENMGDERDGNKQENMRNEQDSKKGKDMEEEQDNNKQENTEDQADKAQIEKDTDIFPLSEKTQSPHKAAEPEIIETDWSDYFEGLNGAAVIYDVSEGKYLIFNKELAVTRRSPCSTFKIISSLTALENGILDPDHSMHTWSGEIFWNEDWNHDIEFEEAFRTSCVWYFREIVDETGKDMMQAELNKLQYGNCDISDWEGRLNTNNSNPALTGFWIESSLAISPKEQTEVMERIFGEDSVYSEKTRNTLKQVMLVSGQDKADLSIYGKTGMGKEKGILVDAWFTGFAEMKEKNLYYCIYIGRTEDADVSSLQAKEIAIRLVSDLSACYNNNL